MRKNNTFTILFTSGVFEKGDLLNNGGDQQVIVTSVPNRKWYHRLLQFLTFGLYKASWYYTVKPYNK